MNRLLLYRNFEHEDLVYQMRTLAKKAQIDALFVNSFRRADELAIAMESRCYHGGEGRTRMRVLKFHMGDLAAVIIFAAFITAVALAQRFLPAVKFF